MKKAFLVVAMVAALGASANAVVTGIHVNVTTDSASYNVGDTVKWTITAWTDTFNDGIALLGVTLDEDQNEVMSAALTTGAGIFKSLRGSFSVSSTKGFYSVDTGFQLDGAGTPDSGGTLADILLHMTADRGEATLDVGNDNTEHIFAIGSFTATVPGEHHLTPSLTGANYWPSGSGDATAFTASYLDAAEFTVNGPAPIPEPATLSLIGLGLAGLVGLRRRMK